MAQRGECVAVLGAGGAMGLAIATRLARAGIEVRGWNRTKEKAAPLVQEEGASLFDTPAQAARDAAAVITMLSDFDAVLEAVEGPAGALEELGDDSVWIQMSTIGEEGTERCLQIARERGLDFIDCPVLGTVQPAQEGRLVMLASGPEHLRARVQRMFDALGHRTIWAQEPGAGSRLKLVANSWVLTVVEGCAETVALAEGLGVDPQLFLEAIAGGTLDLPYLRMKAQLIARREFPPSFRLDLAAKDARLVDESARKHGLDLPLMRTIRERMAVGAQEHGEEDFSATYWTSAGKGRIAS